MGTYNITCVIDFPDQDPTARPTTQSGGQIDTIGSGVTAIAWEVQSNLAPGDADGLQLTGVRFFSDAAKTTRTTPAFFTLPGSSSDDGWTWTISFNGARVPSEVTLYYDLDFRDDTYSDLDWDPTLKVQPRTTSGGSTAGASS